MSFESRRVYSIYIIDVFLFGGIQKKGVQYIVREELNRNFFVVLVLRDVEYDANRDNFECRVMLFSKSKRKNFRSIRFN